MKPARLFLVLVAVGLSTSASAETRRSNDSLAVEAAGASPNVDPGTGTDVEGDEHAIHTKGTGSSGKSAGGPIKGVSVKSGKCCGGDAGRSASGADEDADAGTDPAAKEKAPEPQVYKAKQGTTGKTK